MSADICGSGLYHSFLFDNPGHSDLLDIVALHLPGGLDDSPGPLHRRLISLLQHIGQMTGIVSSLVLAMKAMETR